MGRYSAGLAMLFLVVAAGLEFAANRSDPKIRIMASRSRRSTFLVHHAKLFDPPPEVFVG
jgi:hypothetical protein